MTKIITTISNIILFGLFIALAVWLSPFIIIGAFIYLGYIIYKRTLKKQTLKRIKSEWFSKGKYAFFLYSSSKKWQSYFEQEFIPKIQSKTIIWNWSTRFQSGWNNNLLEAKVLKLFGPIGYFYPIAIIFLPSGEVKTFQFYTPYMKMLKSENKKQDYKNLEKDFLNLLDSL